MDELEQILDLTGVSEAYYFDSDKNVEFSTLHEEKKIIFDIMINEVIKEIEELQNEKIRFISISFKKENFIISRKAGKIAAAIGDDTINLGLLKITLNRLVK